MTETLPERYPEAAPYIEDAVADHGEEWVLEHFYEKIHPLGVLMDMPRKEELPFFDAAEHETMSDEELAEMYRARAQYRENLRAASESSE